MPPLTLKGKNLGEKYRHFNSLVNVTTKNKIKFETILSKYGNTDIEYLFKIDIANKYGNVEYILDVLKSDDMLYVSRAIKNMSWLITDDQYSHIITPEYLHTELFPHMQNKAICKLLLHVRLLLKDERRVDEFYNYFEDSEIKKAVKWLPYCSLTVVQGAIVKHPVAIKSQLFKRICERHPSVFNKFIVKSRDCYYKHYFQKTVFLLQTEAENYLNTLEKIDGYYWPSFSKRSTAAIMKSCAHKILDNKFQYFFNIHISTVAKYVERDEAKNVILSIIKSDDLNHWFSYKNIQPFIKRMPNEGKFDFIKSVFLDKESKMEKSSDPDLLLEDAKHNSLNSENIYQWYRHAPFETAFADMKKLIKTESSPSERAEILKVMIVTSGNKLENILRILSYYRDEHGSDSIKHKVLCINALLSCTNTFKYDKPTWEILNDLFHTAEVYLDNEKNVQKCIEAIIIYKVLHKEQVPDAIEKKFKFNTLKLLRDKLDENEREEVFTYLFNLLSNQINDFDINEGDVNELVLKVCDVVDLLKDWNKNLVDFPKILNKIKEIVVLKHKNEIDVNLEVIYAKCKGWRKLLFEESLILSRRETVYLNALKHDPGVFERHPEEVDAARKDEQFVYHRLLSKLKIYWPQLTKDWIEAYKKLLDHPKLHKAIVRALFSLMSYNEVLSILNVYAPDGPIIIWSEVDDHLLSIRKYFAGSMYVARPPPPLDCVFRYAIGNYLQYALPSITSMCYNMPAVKTTLYLPKLLNSDITLQKLGIRVAFSRLTSDKLEGIFRNMWQCSENPLIRAVIFECTFKLICREGDTSKINRLWELLEIFIDNLSCEESHGIYKALGSVDKIPESLKARFCMKSYTFLKKLPLSANCHHIITDLAVSTASIMDSIDIDFVSNILLEFIDRWLVTKKITKGYFAEVDSMEIVFQSYLLSTTDANEQKRRFSKVYKPWLKHVTSLWEETLGNERVVVFYFKKFLKGLFIMARDNFLDKKYVNPGTIFKELQKELEALLSIEKYYFDVTYIKIMIAYSECYELIKTEVPKPDEKVFYKEDNKQRYIVMWNKIAPLLATKVIQLLKTDIDELFDTIQFCFADCLSKVRKVIDNDTNTFVFERELLKDASFVPAYLLVLKYLPNTCCNDDLNKELMNVRSLLEAHPVLEVKIPSLIKFDMY